MMQRRKVQRAFTGLAGRPYEPDVVAPSPVTSQVPSTSGKVGRPTLGAEAMTEAERTRRSRARKRQVETAPEREKLIRQIVRRIKTSEHADIDTMRRALDKLHDALDALTVEDLRGIAKQYAILHDTKGRTRIEGHTGSKLVASEFIDRIERIYSKSVTAHLYGGQKPAMGASPNVDESADDNDTTSKVPTRQNEITVWDLLPEITESMFDGEEEDIWDVEESTLVNRPTLRCRACNQSVCTWIEARRHAEEVLRAVRKQADYIRTLEEAKDKSESYNVMLADAKSHYQEKLYRHDLLVRNFVTDGGNRKSSVTY